jgi:hypothetical protein
MPTNPETWQKRQEAIRELLARKAIGSQEARRARVPRHAIERFA